MAQPSGNIVRVDRVLTNLSVAYMQDDANFVADKIFPSVPVDDETGIYYEYERGSWLRDDAQPRTSGSESAGGGFKINQKTYKTTRWDFHNDVGDDDVKRLGDLPVMQDATDFVTRKIMLRRENDFADKFFKTGIWTNEVVGVAAAPGASQVLRWDVSATSNPVGNVRSAMTTMGLATGYRPNVLVVSQQVFDVLIEHPQVRDYIKYSSDQVVTEDILARLFGLDRVVVVKAVQNTANEGAADANAFTYGKHALLVYAPARAGMRAPSAGYVFSWKGISDGLGQTVRVKRFYMAELEITRVEAASAFDMRLVSADLGYFFNNIIS